MIESEEQLVMEALGKRLNLNGERVDPGAAMEGARSPFVSAPHR